MIRGGPPSRVEVARRIADAIAKSLIAPFNGLVQVADLQSFAAEAAVEALHAWNGLGQFEGFAAQRIRWAVIKRVRREILRRLPGEEREEGCAAVAAERAVETFDRSPDEAAAPLPSPVELAAAALDAYRVELACLDEVVEVADPNADVERTVERMKLRRAIQRLPVPENAIVERYVYVGENIVEIAKALGMRRSTVHDAYHRGIGRLLATLGEQPSPEAATTQALAPA